LENSNYTSQIVFPKYFLPYKLILKYSSCYCKILYMKHNNRFDKKIEEKILSEIDPKDLRQIDQMLAELEIIWKKWVKSHPDWKSHE